MRKFILAVTFVIASASIGASYVSAQEQDSKGCRRHGGCHR